MPEPSDLSAHAARNRDVWNADAPNWVENGRKAWASPTPWWGMWEIPEEELRILPDVAGLDVLDLGCGTGYWCAWFARLGARPVGLDLSEEQLATARELQAEHGIEFPLIHASAEAPPLPDGSFDIVFSEYGAAIWCDPYVWIPQAHRLLRPGGRLIFLAHAAARRASAHRSATSPPARPSSGRSGPGSDRVAGRRGSTSTSPTASGSSCCATPASRSRRSTSCMRRMATRTRSATSCVAAGRRSGPARRSGWRAAPIADQLA